MTKPYKLNGKLFRYDEERSIVEYIIKASDEAIQEEVEWEQKHGSQLYGIDADGYIVVDSVGLRKENWNRKEVRDEYLAGWCDELDEESAALADDFVKYELPYLTGGAK